GLSAGRKDSEYALFPYYTDDKITESADITGSKTIIRIPHPDGSFEIWEPFSERYLGKYQITRNLYKHVYGNKIRFEEINHDLGLSFYYQWSFSDRFGFVRTSQLLNQGDQAKKVELLDGIQNIMPAGVGSYTQNQSSNLVDAYKRSELEPETGLGIFALSAIIVDKAEPSEALKANIVWSLGLEKASYLLSSLQLKSFRQGAEIQGEVDVKAEKGAYFVHTSLTLAPGQEKTWHIIADVNQTHGSLAKISKMIQEEAILSTFVDADVAKGMEALLRLNAAADGRQCSADQLRDARHFSNTLFNIMRGGIFDDNYQIEKWDFRHYLQKANPAVFKASQATLKELPAQFTLGQLSKMASQSQDVHFRRLCHEYLPLKFSRRHGDPSRPWNRFSINTRSEVDGSKILDYEGNWRDIFQNWEALAHSYPGFVESMIHKFLNATTFDGYNPYRVTKDGFDWETIEPDDPWSYIGYWGDHQIIYLLKLLEMLEDRQPGRLADLLAEEVFVYAHVPYRIKSYADILKNPKDTIEFDEEADDQIRQERLTMGADGALLKNKMGTIHSSNFTEKILATTLAKLSNFIPEGGIWMNTQRPEWNDANNALVGNGVSMVTLYYLRRFLNFLDQVLAEAKVEQVMLSEELADFYEKIAQTLQAHQGLMAGSINNKDKKTVLDGLGQAASDYRLHIYDHTFSGSKKAISLEELKSFMALARQYMEHSIQANRRDDHMYHAYNLMSVLGEDEVDISYLSEMLEGQVAALSSGYLKGQAVLDLLNGMKNSALFRPDQYSYLLYPNKNLAGFKARNIIPESSFKRSQLLQKLVEDDNKAIIEFCVRGEYHFNGNFRNAQDLKDALDGIADSSYSSLVNQDYHLVLQIFEEVFNHKAFTGRSGTFFGYEGLGSIYWHMVSKLLLAVQECCLRAIHEQESPELIGHLLEHYYEIDAGIGVHKPPTLYGAFPTDPYSHTPAGKGAQQPGMTGQVKEDIISRFGELGVFVKEGQLLFDPSMLRKGEFLNESTTFTHFDVQGQMHQFPLEAGSLAFTYCQIPIIYQLAEEEGIDVRHQDGPATHVDGLKLDSALSQEVFGRTGSVIGLNVKVNPRRLK
ncbi:MAG: hypothetical protein AAFU64_00560, partial [Bacteroidota bacterium]